MCVYDILCSTVTVLVRKTQFKMLQICVFIWQLLMIVIQINLMWQPLKLLLCKWQKFYATLFLLHSCFIEFIFTLTWSTTSSSQFFSNPLRFSYQKFSHIFLTFVMTFGVNIQNTLGEISEKIAWKLEQVVTTLNKTINNISSIFSYYF